MTHQVVLRADVARLGKAGEAVTVSPGYARNYLIPRGLAWAATPGTLKQAQVEAKRQAVRLERQVKEAKDLAKKFEKIQCTIKKSAGEEGKLFGTVTGGDVAKALAAHQLTVDRRSIVLTEPIKSLGMYTVSIRLAPDVEAKVKVLVEKE